MKISDTVLTLLLFNTTQTAASVIKDYKYRHQAKNWFSNWFNSGNKLWKEIKSSTKDVPEAIDSYEELSAYLYEVCKIALEKDDYNEFLKSIQSDNAKN